MVRRCKYTLPLRLTNLEKFQAIDRAQRKPLKLRVYQLCAVELMKKLAKKKLDYRGGMW